LQQNAEAHIFFDGKVKDFLDSEEKSVYEFQDLQCMGDFGFIADITGDMDELNCYLQCKDQLIHIFYCSIKGYQTKLILWECQLKTNN
jgi:hypothetical protein